MATHEERLTTLEQFRTETMRAYTDMAYEVTILKGLGEDSIKRLAALQREMNERFARVDETLAQHTAMLNQILAKLDERT